MSSEANKVTINGFDYDEEVVQTASAIMGNARGLNPAESSGIGGADYSSDASITRWLGSQYDGNRDIYDVLGYDDLDTESSLEKFRAKYNRQDIAKRIIDAFPEETWKKPPKVVDDGETDSEFETQVNRLLKNEVTAYFRRLDRAQRLGEYGVMMVGYADGQDLDQPVQESALSSPDDIAFYNVFPQEQVENWILGKETDGEESDPTHPRFNKPVYYTLDFGDIDAESQDDDFKEVHYTRVPLHPAEGALETDLKGTPALKPVYNRLQDREKVIGASAEMFYTGADRKIIANVKDDFALEQYSDTGEREDFQDQLTRLINDMQQSMVGTGMEYEVISGQEVNPQGVIDTIDSSIAAAIGMPKNKLQGNEMGERSTTQDRLNWFDNIKSRQSNFSIPNFVRPFINTLIEYGILPSPNGEDYAVKFPDLVEQTEADKAEIQSQRASALGGSQLAMTLSTSQKLEFLQGGAEAVTEDNNTTTELPINEANPNVQDYWNGAFNQDIDLTPPESAKNNAQKVLDWREDPDKKVSGMTSTGWDRAKQLASGDELSPQDIQNIAAWFSRHGPEEYELNDPNMDPWEDNGRVSILGWGGETMREWVKGKRSRLTEMGELEPVE